ncbi:MAG: HEAT repeat domain-containing protein [Deltaproteobacteria bacterium]|nr:HEAT repeat domain-containing protein [Deltaproteobacteria bacterium]
MENPRPKLGRWATCVALGGAAVAAPLPPCPALAAPKQAQKATAGQLIKQIIALSPSKDRDAAVDDLIELGEAAWLEVRAALDAIAASNAGEDVVVDLLLGFGAPAWEDILTRTPKMNDLRALRVARQVLRFASDDRQAQLLESLLGRGDEALLLLVLPELVARNRPAVLLRLVELVDDQRPGVRNFAIDTLVAKKHTAALPALVRRLGVERLKPTADNLTLRIKIINAIAHIGADTDAPVPPLMEALELPDQRDAVLDALQVVGAPSVRAAAYLLQTAERNRIETALIVLSHLRIHAAPELVPVLGNARDETTRALIADVLAHLAVPEVRAEILRMVRERKFSELRQGLLLAVTLYDAQVRQLLVELAGDKDLGVRRIALDLLWRLADPETWPVLRHMATRDEDVHTRILALRAMVGTGDPKVVDYLHKLAVVNNVDERLEVLQAIGRVDDLGGAPVLAQQLSDPNDAVFRAALNSLRRLTFHNGPRREAEWLAWIEAENQKKSDGYEETEAVLHRFDVDGREMGWLEAGSPDDKTIVVVAGAPYRDAGHLMPHVWRLAGSYHVAVLQRGISPFSAATLSEAVLSQELGKMLQALKKKQVALLGDHTTAHFVLRYGNEHPDRVAAVLLHGGPWPTVAAVRGLPGEIEAALPQPWKEDALWAQQQAGLLVPALRQKVLARAHLAAILGDPEFARGVRPTLLFDDGFSLQARDRALADAATFDPAKAQVPMLVLQGTKAPWSKSTFEAIDKLPAGVRKQIKLVRLEDCGAMPLVEAADAAVAAVKEFLR